MRKWLFLILLLFPVLALASSTAGGLFSVAPTDKSMQYLGIALGGIPGTPIQSSGNSMVGSLIYVFNQVIFVLGIIVVIYTTVVGVMNTAQEGEFLGKKWHPILVPLRAALGIYLLLPSTSGYNWIQITVMWFIVQGVGAANALWKQVITFNQTSGTIRQNSSVVNMLNAGDAVVAIFNNNVCMLSLNTNPTAFTLLGESITAYQWNNQVQWGRFSQAGIEEPLCGSVTIPLVGGSLFNPAGTSDPNAVQGQAALANAVLAAQSALMPAAYQALSGTGSTSLGASAFTAASNILATTANNLGTSFESLDDINQQAIVNGWIHAGSYYFQLVQNGVGPGINVTFSTSSQNADALNTILGPTLAGQLMSNASSLSQTYTNTVSTEITTPSTQNDYLKLNSKASNPNVQSVLAIIFGGLVDKLVKSLNDEMTSGGANQDPIVSIASFGATLSTAVEITFWAALGLLFFLWFGTHIMTCIQPLGPALDFMLSMLIPIAIIILLLLFSVGIMMALYIPLIPFLVFTFCAIGWIILVIEALMGSSLIALTLIVPSEDEIGKAGHAMVILLGLFLRPALMIVGFIMAIQLLGVAFKMLKFGFWATIVSSTGTSASLGIFGMVALLSIFVAIITTLTHEAFSLIYLLPNKVLRWMGGTGEEDDVAGKLKEAKGSIEKGDAIGKSAMGGALKKFASKGDSGGGGGGEGGGKKGGGK